MVPYFQKQAKCKLTKYTTIHMFAKLLTVKQTYQKLTKASAHEEMTSLLKLLAKPYSMIESYGCSRYENNNCSR